MNNSYIQILYVICLTAPKIPRRLIKDQLNILSKNKQEVSSIKFQFCFHKKKIFWKQLDYREREEEGHNAYVYIQNKKAIYAWDS